MNPYQVMGIIVSCTLVFAGVVSLLVMQGVPVLLAFLGVYLLAVWVMVGMQRRAREFYDGKEHSSQRRYDRDSANRTAVIRDHAGTEKAVDKVVQREHLHA